MTTGGDVKFVDKFSDTFRRLGDQMNKLESGTKTFNAALGGLDGGLAGLAGSLGALGGPLAAVGAVLTTFTLAKQGADLQRLRGSFFALAQEFGQSGDAIIEKLKAIAKGTVDDSDLMQIATKGLAQGGSLIANRLPELFQVARTQARISGQDVVQVYDTLIQAISGGNPKLLKSIGLFIDQSRVSKEAAAAIKSGADTSELHARATATMNLAVEKSTSLQKALGTTNEDNVDVWNRLTASLKNAKEAFSNMLNQSPLIVTALKNISDNADRLTHVFDIIAARGAFDKLKKDGVIAAGELETAIDGVGVKQSELNELFAEDKKLNKELNDLQSKTGIERLRGYFRIAAIQRELNENEAEEAIRGEELVKVRKKVADEQERAAKARKQAKLPGADEGALGNLNIQKDVLAAYKAQLDAEEKINAIHHDTLGSRVIEREKIQGILADTLADGKANFLHITQTQAGDTEHLSALLRERGASKEQLDLVNFILTLRQKEEEIIKKSADAQAALGKEIGDTIGKGLKTIADAPDLATGLGRSFTAIGPGLGAKLGTAIGGFAGPVIGGIIGPFLGSVFTAIFGDSEAAAKRLDEKLQANLETIRASADKETENLGTYGTEIDQLQQLKSLREQNGLLGSDAKLTAKQIAEIDKEIVDLERRQIDNSLNLIDKQHQLGRASIQDQIEVTQRGLAQAQQQNLGLEKILDLEIRIKELKEQQVAEQKRLNEELIRGLENEFNFKVALEEEGFINAKDKVDKLFAIFKQAQDQETRNRLQLEIRDISKSISTADVKVSQVEQTRTIERPTVNNISIRQDVNLARANIFGNFDEFFTDVFGPSTVRLFDETLRRRGL